MTVNNDTRTERQKIKDKLLMLYVIGECEKAVARYLQGLEVDLKVEEFYQRLMVCYARMGRNADAVAIYKRCQKNLNSMLKVEPSSKTKSIYKNILSKSTS